MNQRLNINEKVPKLKLQTTDQNNYDLSATNPEKFTMLVFYRGLHCPVCKTYLQDLNTKIEDLKKLGVSDIVAISGDTKEKAQKAKEEWSIENVKLSFEQSIESMKEWGLYISESIKDAEPSKFGEPALMLVGPDKKLFYAAYNSMPFGRPDLGDMLDAIKFINSESYPSRGKFY